MSCHVMSKAVLDVTRLAAVTITAVPRVVQDMDEDGGIPPPEGGKNGKGQILCVSRTMDDNVDLSNSSHCDDNNNASQGFSIWAEDSPGTTRDL